MRQQSPTLIDFAPYESDSLHGSMPFFILGMTRDTCLQVLYLHFSSYSARGFLGIKLPCSNAFTLTTTSA